MVIRDIRAIESGRGRCHNRPMPGQPAPRAKPARATPRRIVVTLAAVVALMLAACGSTDRASHAPNSPAPSVAPTSSQAATAGPSSSPLTPEQLAALYQTIEGQVVQIRGLHPKSPVNPTVLDDAGIRKITSEAFDRDNPPAVIEANQRMYAALGMLPPGASLHDLYVELLGSQVAGLYSPTD